MRAICIKRLFLSWLYANLNTPTVDDAGRQYEYCPCFRVNSWEVICSSTFARLHWGCHCMSCLQSDTFLLVTYVVIQPIASTHLFFSVWLEEFMHRTLVRSLNGVWWVPFVLSCDNASAVWCLIAAQSTTLSSKSYNRGHRCASLSVQSVKFKVHINASW